MSKKIVAVLTVATLLFLCVFAACGKEDSLYIDDKEYEFVTDENGEKVLADDGRLLVYETDKNGKIVKDENGEPLTEAKQFQPIENDGVVEDYGYILTLPEGWETTDVYNSFVNPDLDIKCNISVVKYLYDDYYERNKSVYDGFKEEKIECEWEEDLDFSEDYKGICRFMYKIEGQFAVMYFFSNSGNTYKLLFEGTYSDEAVKSAESFCKAMELKPYTYYNDITEVSTTAN